MRAVDCVGALILDAHHRVYVQRRTAERRLLPGIWDIVGGHLEPGETPEEALAREVEEETGWKVRDIVWTVADWEWEYEGRVRRELDYLITVDGDLARPRLEAGKHDACAWVGPDDLDLLMVNRTDGDRRLRDIVAHVVRTRFTDRLRLEPMTGPDEVLPGHAADLVTLHSDPWVAQWYAGTWSDRGAPYAEHAESQAGWERDGVSKWMAYERVERSAGRAGRTVPDRRGHVVGRGHRASWWDRTGRPTGSSSGGRCSSRPAGAGWRPRSAGPGWTSPSGRWRQVGDRASPSGSTRRPGR